MHLLASPRLALLVALALPAALLTASPQTAEACSPALPSIKVLGPVDGQTGVPTNTKIWLDNSAAVSIQLKSGPTTIGGDAEKLLPTVYAVTPLLDLEPNTEYTATASSTQDIAPVTWRFTTGAGPARDSLLPPWRLDVTAERVKDEGNSCVGSLDGYRVRISTSPVLGAALYELAVEENGAFLATEITTLPQMTRFIDELPSPRYRVRPISLSGMSTFAGELPAESVTDADNEGGCSVTGSRSSALWFVSALLGLGLMARRRRAASR